MSKEYLWVGKLDSSKKEVVFNPSEEGDEKLAAIGHSLLLKRAVLGPCSDSDINVVEMETTGYLEDEIKATLCCLQPSDSKKYDQCLLDTLIPHGETKFRLVQGSGPITLFGQHIAVDFLGEDELLSGDEEDESLDDPKEVEELLADKKGIKKRKNAKGGGLPKKMPKMDMDDEFEDDEDFDDGDLDDDEEFTPGKAKKKTTTPKKETNAKKAPKASKKKN